MTLDRRSFLNACSTAGIASPLLPGILYTLAAQAQESAPATAPAAPPATAQAQESTSASPLSSAAPAAPALPKITNDMLDQAAALAGIGPFTAGQKMMMLDGLNDQRSGYDNIRA